MKLNLKPVEIPFKVNDTIFVNQPYASLALGDSTGDRKVYFQALIVRIFLEFSDKVSIVSERKDVHDLEVTSIIYDLKPLGEHEEAGRIALRVDLETATQTVFGSEEKLLAYQRDTV